MEKQTLIRRDLLGAKKINPDTSAVEASQIFSLLEENANIKERDLVSYLDVNEKTLRNWKSPDKPVSQSGKLLRLIRLNEVVKTALANSLPKQLIRQLLVAPLDLKDKEQKSILDMIKDEPDSQYFTRMVSLLVESFISRTNTNGHYILSNEDFDKLIEELDNDKEPSEAVKRARETFLKMKSKA
ncbi:MAG: hypothetical protein KDD58_06730 [Bdellovibrionales bacterium]|nr:hypothetical protein [Bdellovibrionales bacterium]